MITKIVAWSSLLFAFLLLVGFRLARPPRVEEPSKAPPRSQLIAHPAIVDFGMAQQGSPAVRKPVLLENPGGEPVSWDAVDSDCDCVSLRFAESMVPAKGRLSGEVVLDLSHSPSDFAGGLRSDVRFLAKDKQVLLVLTIRAELIRRKPPP
jgi:hypothetical protein